MPRFTPLINREKPSTSPVVIAGPCAAESEAQVMETATALAAAGTNIFRAGVWKPRTKPGCFVGMGEKALPWLSRVKEETGLAVATEVGSRRHVLAAVDAGIDILWIGARTSANPFAVQEIADAIAETGADVGVMVKNPVNPDTDLWQGAVQRLEGAGLRRLAAVHRGFSCYGVQTYRNPPKWYVPIELRRRMPDLPMLCDPSHIAGRRDLIAQLAQQALDMDFDGLMIEVHPNPDAAMSDAAQQLTPLAFTQLMRSLTIRRRDGDAAGLEALRDKIDECDRELLEVLARRMEVSREIGEFKRSRNIPAVQIQRHDSIMRSREQTGLQLGLPPQFTRRIMAAVHEESVRRQLEILNSPDTANTPMP